MTITISQIKAARALLGWNQEQLAENSEISKPALANIERGKTTPRPNTLAAIQYALETAGIDFTDGPGVRLARDRLDVSIFRGNDSIYRLWDDILSTLKVGEERLISSIDETKFIDVTSGNFQNMMEKYKEKGIRGRILSLKGDINFADPTSDYRWVSKTRFLDISYYVYADKYAILLWEPVPRVVLVQNSVIAESYRNQFNRHWDEAEIPRQSHFLTD